MTHAVQPAVAAAKSDYLTTARDVCRGWYETYNIMERRQR